VLLLLLLLLVCIGMTYKKVAAVSVSVQHEQGEPSHWLGGTTQTFLVGAF
jgi:hypothetical protein